MAVETWVAFCLTEAVLCFTPGPAVLLVVSSALGGGCRPGLSASLGAVAANTLYFALSATGVAAALVASRELFFVLKWVGAAYLIWLGLRMLGSHTRPTTSEAPRVVARSFARGFVVQGANPKALVFFVALLPQFLDASRPIAGQLLILAASSAAIELFALGTYVYGAVRVGRVAGAGVASMLERVGGGLLLAAGARLALERPE